MAIRYKRIPCRHCSNGVLVASYAKRKIDTCYACGVRIQKERDAKEAAKDSKSVTVDGPLPGVDG